MRNIQLVDDDSKVLAALSRLLRRQGWNVYTYDTVDKALNGLITHNFAVIIADYRMPTADGITYLQFAKQRCPSAVRMVLSAYGDRKSLIQAINQAEVYRYLSKPWDDCEVLAAIQSAVGLFEISEENRKLREESQRYTSKQWKAL